MNPAFRLFGLRIDDAVIIVPCISYGVFSGRVIPWALCAAAYYLTALLIRRMHPPGPQENPEGNP